MAQATLAALSLSSNYDSLKPLVLVSWILWLLCMVSWVIQDSVVQFLCCFSSCVAVLICSALLYYFCSYYFTAVFSTLGTFSGHCWLWILVYIHSLYLSSAGQNTRQYFCLFYIAQNCSTVVIAVSIAVTIAHWPELAYVRFALGVLLFFTLKGMLVTSNFYFICQLVMLLRDAALRFLSLPNPIFTLVSLLYSFCYPLRTLLYLS